MHYPNYALEWNKASLYSTKISLQLTALKMETEHIQKQKNIIKIFFIVLTFLRYSKTVSYHSLLPM
jgi:hypothetical protein